MGLFKRRSEDLFTIAEPVSSGFRLVVSDVFGIAGRGTVVTGTVEAGTVVVGAQVIVERTGQPPLAAEIAGIEMFRKMTKRAVAGDNVGLLFRELTRAEIAVGDVVRSQLSG